MHLLFGKGFGCDGGGLVVVRDWVMVSGGALGMLFVVAKGVGGDSRLAPFDSFLGGFEMIFESGPGFVS